MNKQHLGMFVLFALYGTLSIILLAYISNKVDRQNPGVVYLQDYDCSMKYTHAKEELNAYAGVLHRIWLDRPSYVEDVLFETDEFCTLNEVSDYGDIFEFWSEQDSIQYHNSRKMEETEADLYLKHYREPDVEPYNLMTR